MARRGRAGGGRRVAIASAAVDAGERPQPGQYRQLTFRRGTITTAALRERRRHIVYGAALDGAPFRVFFTRAGAPSRRRSTFPPPTSFRYGRRGNLRL